MSDVSDQEFERLSRVAGEDLGTQSFHLRMEQLLSKFPNSRERMRTSPLFHVVISSLVRGGDPLLVLLQERDQLVDYHERSTSNSC